MKLVISSLALFLVSNMALANDAASAAASATASTPAADAAAPATGDSAAKSGLIIKDSKVGTGAEAVAGRDVVVNYTGWLHDPKAKDGRGKKFDSSVGRAPFDFPLGGGRVIKGWDQGVVGMKEGGKRTLIIPPELAYGERNIAGGLIPPHSTLVFDVELIKVK